MPHAIAVVLGLIVGLFDLILAAIGAVEHALRDALSEVGVTGPAQRLVLIVALVAMAIAALRLFGRVFAVLIVMFLLLLLIETLMPGLAAGGAGLNV